MCDKPTYEKLEREDQELESQIPENSSLSSVRRKEVIIRAEKDNDSKFKTIFDISPHAIALTEVTSGRMLDVNEMLCEVRKYSREELIGKTTTECGFYSAADRSRFMEELQLSGEVRGMEMLFRAKDGSKITTLIFARPVQIEGEAFILTMLQDITDRKRLETRLKQAQKMEAIGTLAGGIAHDFNNILGIIVGNAEMATNDVPEQNRARHNLEEVIKASLRARDMVKQILSFSRQTEEEWKPVRVSRLIEESLKLLRFSIPATIDIRKDISSHADTVLADATQIEQIMMNLCTNAAHAMRKKGGILEVTLNNIKIEGEGTALHHDLTPGKYLVFSVSDTGHGMQSDILERIFDPYYTTKEVGEGTGMGLSVVHGIVKNHNGGINVHSEPEKGSTFEVFLPLVEGVVDPEPEEFERLPTGSERILFVDDEETLADLGKLMLQHLGYETSVRTSSIEALEAFRAQPDKFDLVVTDMTMPGMTGLDLTEELLRIRSVIPVILCSGLNQLITEDKTNQMGIKAFIMKPMVMRELSATIRRVLNRDEEKKELTSGHILVVEDDDQMRGTLRQILEEAGHQVVEATDGKVGTRIYRQDPTDLIITDLIMPEKEGLELIMELRHDFPEVKIIAISGGGRIRPEEYLPMAKNLGALRTFEKPFNREELLAAVQDILN